MQMCTERWWNDTDGGKREVQEGKPGPVPLCTPQMLCGRVLNPVLRDEKVKLICTVACREVQFLPRSKHATFLLESPNLKAVTGSSVGPYSESVTQKCHHYRRWYI